MSLPLTNEHVYTISELNHIARSLLEEHFSFIWIEGEISNFSAPNSGHWYFSLKDKNAQVRCAMFRMQNRALKFMPDNGMHVIVRAKVSLYESRGDFQLIVEQLEEIGFGALQRAFEQLKNQLDKEGLFKAIHKKPPPEFPQCIGVITSPTGAAIKDILSVLKRRMPIIPVIIYQTLVQGDLAAPQIVRAIEIANERQECDVLLITRGGGSLEDLWSFNEEIVARTIFDSTIPIVAGIGHEIDFTIADFVADVRAPTPSAAAELISPDQKEILKKLNQTQQRFLFNIRNQFSQLINILNTLTKHLNKCHPARLLQEQSQTFDHIHQRLLKAQQILIEVKRNQLKMMNEKLWQQNPTHTIQHNQLRLNNSTKALKRTINQILHDRKNQMTALARALNSVNPLKILERGYSVIIDAKNKIIKNAEQVKIGDKITAQLAKGKLTCHIDEAN